LKPRALSVKFSPEEIDSWVVLNFLAWNHFCENYFTIIHRDNSRNFS
jgi:hypothetical protein